MTHEERRMRWMVGVGVLAIHVALFAGLIRAFTPEFAENVVKAVTQAFTVTPVASPPPLPSPSPTQEQVADSASVAPPREQGAGSSAGKKAKPREISAPVPPLVIASNAAPPVAGQGSKNETGAKATGGGTGSGGFGKGTGTGASGTGDGGGGGKGSPTVKIRGDINSARDYPRDTRNLRIGASVTIDIVVATDGRVKHCRIVQASPDAEADRITCALATRRFQFRPALNAAGEPVEAVYRWRQRWFY